MEDDKHIQPIVTPKAIQKDNNQPLMQYKSPNTNQSENKPSNSKFKKIKYWLSERLSRKQLIIGGIIFVLLLSGIIAFGLTRKANAPQPVVKSINKPKPIVYT